MRISSVRAGVEDGSGLVRKQMARGGASSTKLDPDILEMLVEVTKNLTRASGAMKKGSNAKVWFKELKEANRTRYVLYSAIAGHEFATSYRRETWRTFGARCRRRFLNG